MSIIAFFTKDGASESGTWNTGNVYGRVALLENETDPLNKIDIVLSLHAIVKNMGSASANFAEGRIKVQVSESATYNALIKNPSRKIDSKKSVTFNIPLTMATVDRGDSPSTYSGKLTVISSTISRDANFSLTIPPRKQRLANGNNRLTYTVDGVKYDVLNLY